MIKYLYCYKNTIGNFFSVPFSLDAEPKDMPEVLKATLCVADDKLLNSLKEDDLYYVGTFDTITGVICPCSDFIAHVSEIVNRLISLKEGKEKCKKKK